MSDIALSGAMYAKYSLDYALGSVRRAGCDKMEFWGGVAHGFPGYKTPEEAAGLLRKTQRAGVRIVSMLPDNGKYPFNISSGDRAVARDTVAYYRRCVDWCAAMEIGQITIHPGWQMLDEPPKTAWRGVAPTLRRVAEYALKRGVVPAILCGGTSVARTYAQAVELADRVDVAELGVAADLSIAYANGESLEELLRPEGRLRTLYLSDGPGRLAFGDGSMPMRELCAQIETSRYRGILVLLADDRRYTLNAHEAAAKTAAALQGYETATCGQE